MAGFGDARRSAYDAAARADHWRATYAGLSAFERHQRLLQQLSVYGGGGGEGGGDGGGGGGDATAALAHTRTDADVLREVRGRGPGRPPAPRLRSHPQHPRPAHAASL
jgi:hypothetical protein